MDWDEIASLVNSVSLDLELLTVDWALWDPMVEEIDHLAIKEGYSVYAKFL